jgi:drug/metabolite transporter (DMT)-like permease
MTTVVAQRPKLQDANLTSIVGMTLGVVPVVGLIVSTVALVAAIRERSHPGLALIGIALGLFAIGIFAVGFGFVLYAASVTGFDFSQTYTLDELRAFYEQVSKK